MNRRIRYSVPDLQPGTMIEEERIAWTVATGS